MNPNYVWWTLAVIIFIAFFVPWKKIVSKKETYSEPEPLPPAAGAASTVPAATAATAASPTPPAKTSGWGFGRIFGLVVLLVFILGGYFLYLNRNELQARMTLPTSNPIRLGDSAVVEATQGVWSAPITINHIPGKWTFWEPVDKGVVSCSVRINGDDSLIYDCRDENLGLPPGVYIQSLSFKRESSKEVKVKVYRKSAPK